MYTLGTRLRRPHWPSYETVGRPGRGVGSRSGKLEPMCALRLIAAGLRVVASTVIAVAALVLFATAILPRVRAQLRLWEGVADGIPDPVLRSQALESLREKAANAEAAAVFSILAPRRRRGEVIALLVSLQVLTDYLDTVGEDVARDPLRNNMALHEALVNAVGVEPATGFDYYRHHPRTEDGGFVRHLVGFCQSRVRVLPAMAVVQPFAREAARRCAAGQSYTHAALHQGPGVLEAWATELAAGTGYRWWEAAAGASSSVAVHALLAIAADARTSRRDAARIDAIYYLDVGCLTVLLDNLVDRDDDTTGGAHNYLRYYGCSVQAAARLGALVQHAVEGTRDVPRRRRHDTIVAGVLGFYMSAPGAFTSYARPIRVQILERAGPAVWPILFAMRARRGLRRS